jgi:hypothetical protein
MDAALIKMILMATGVVVVTTGIAKVLKIGTLFTEESKRAQELGRHCCLPGLTELSRDLTAPRDDGKASGQ